MGKDKVNHRKGVITIDKMVEFAMDNLATQKFRVGTSVTTPTKLFKLNKNDWYLLQ